MKLNIKNGVLGNYIKNIGVMAYDIEYKELSNGQ